MFIRFSLFSIFNLFIANLWESVVTILISFSDILKRAPLKTGLDSSGELANNVFLINEFKFTVLIEKLNSSCTSGNKGNSSGLNPY